MSQLEWDKVGERRFETGVDRGVLYSPSGDVVPWNGLVSIDEDRQREVKSYYADGIKYLDHSVPGTYKATLSAFTYPDELDELLGVGTFAPGVFVHDQPAKPFSFSYRTREGNDVDGADAHYKIHVVYNVTANPGNLSMETQGDSVSPQAFTWTLTGVPQLLHGIRPTAHVSFHTRGIAPAVLTQLEKFLYGTEVEDPALPSLLDILNLIEDFS